MAFVVKADGFRAPLRFSALFLLPFSLSLLLRQLIGADVGWGSK